MKKGWKIFAIVCVIIFCIGAIGCVAALGLGFNIDHFRTAYGIKDGYKESISDIVNPNDTDHAQSTHNIHDSQDSDHSNGQYFDGVENMDIDVQAVGVIVSKYSGTSVMVDGTGISSKLKLEIKMDGTTLKVETTGTVHGINSENIGTLYIQIPESLAFNETDISVGAGTFYADVLQTKTLDLELGAGDADIESLICEDVKAEVGAGQLTLKPEGTLEQYNYDLEYGLGKITLGNDRSYSGVGKEMKINNGATKNIKVECGMGNVEIYPTMN